MNNDNTRRFLFPLAASDDDSSALRGPDDDSCIRNPSVPIAKAGATHRFEVRPFR